MRCFILIFVTILVFYIFWYYYYYRTLISSSLFLSILLLEKCYVALSFACLVCIVTAPLVVAVIIIEIWCRQWQNYHSIGRWILGVGTDGIPIEIGWNCGCQWHRDCGCFLSQFCRKSVAIRSETDRGLVGGHVRLGRSQLPVGDDENGGHWHRNCGRFRPQFDRKPIGIRSGSVSNRIPINFWSDCGRKRSQSHSPMPWPAALVNRFSVGVNHNLTDN